MSSAALRNKFPTSKEEFFVHETTTCRLLRYSTFGGTSSLSPRRIIHPWGDNSSTTTVLDSSWDKISISQEDLFIHEVTIRRLLRYSTQAETRSLFPRRTYSSMRWQFVVYYGTRLKLRQDSSSIFQEDLFIHEVTIRRLLRCQARDSGTVHRHGIS